MAAAPVRTFNPFRVLAVHRNFRLFWSGQTLSLIGTWMQSMAQGWLALELTDSALLVGLVASVGSLPVLLLSLPAGALVDRGDKLRLLIVAQSLLALEALVLWGFVWSGHVTIGWLLALSAIGGAVGALEIPARQSLMVELVGREDLTAAIALNSSGFNLARIVGPAVAAAVIAHLGIAWCFGINALSYVTVLAGLLLVRLPRRERPVVTSSALGGVVEGLRYVRETPELRELVRVVAVFSVLGIPYITLMPVVARDMLGTGAAGYGLLLSSIGMGGLTGALALAGVLSHVPRGWLLRRAAFLYAALLLLFALVRVPALAYPVLFATGAAMIICNSTANSMLQTLVPDAFRGRLMSVYALLVIGLGQVFGSFAAGAVARQFGVQWAIGAAAALLLAFAWRAFSGDHALARLEE
jgi:MFS family permease